MRERSQEFGKQYVGATKKWLLGHSLFGYKVSEFGDAYDASSHATGIGGSFFDFSFKLIKKGVAVRILYGECKFRDERNGSTKKAFEEYLRSVYRALKAADNDRRRNSLFLFVTTVPPDSWRRFLKDKVSFIKEILASEPCGIDDSIVSDLNSQVDIIVLSERLILETD